MSLDLEVSMGMEEDTDTDLVGYTQTTQQHLTVPGGRPGPAKRRREQRSASEPRRGLHGLQGLRGLTPPKSPELEQGMQRKRLRSPPPEPAQEELELEQEEESTDVVLVKSTPLQKYARALRRKEQVWIHPSVIIYALPTLSDFVGLCRASSDFVKPRPHVVKSAAMGFA
jgi:hypothetical protein